MTTCVRSLLMIVVLMFAVTPARAQGGSDDWTVVVYPILGWAPVFGADVPSIPSPPDGGGGGGGGSTSGGGIDTTLNGALLFGFSVEKGPWRVGADGMWAALFGDRPVRPTLTVDLDLIYGHAVGARRLYKELYVTGGVRRLAMKYEIQLEDFPHFSRKPGLWDPLIGVAWHHQGSTLEWHAEFEGGGFGVGADEDLFAGLRLDWKPISHFRVTFGYGVIHLELTESVLGQEFRAVQTLQGPILGVGFDF